MRRAISIMSASLNAAGAARCELSIEIATSALLRAGRDVLPEKMTSSIDAARIDLCEASPITQRSASTRFDLPQPFGPTTPVRPGSIRKSVGSTNDLKPRRRSRVNFMLGVFRIGPGACDYKSAGDPASRIALDCPPGFFRRRADFDPALPRQHGHTPADRQQRGATQAMFSRLFAGTRGEIAAAPARFAIP